MTAFIIRELWKGKSLTRAYLNLHLRGVRFRGRTIDLGAGRDQNYLAFHPDSRAVERLDVKLGAQVDFETDALPLPNAAFETALLFNVLEHLFDPAHLLADTRRVLRLQGTLQGFVPFLMRYHADPHDYVRYTDEALVRILARAGWSEMVVTPLGEGPFIAALQQVLPCFPRPLRPLFFVLSLCLDRMFLRLRPYAKAAYPLGYFFSAIRGA
jgi:SAM-dependent methyltransferase